MKIPRKLSAWLWMFRPNRSFMVAAISGTASFAAGAPLRSVLGITLAAWFLAVGGFSLDFYADRDLDAEGPRRHIRHNPLAYGAISPRAGLAFSTGFLLLSFVLVLAVRPLSLLPWLAVLGVVLGLALHRFETPISRALTLGLLQALYFIMGSLTARMSPGLWMLAGMFFFAMFGGRGYTDIRDYPQDVTTRVRTLPMRFGVRGTAIFSTVCLFIAYALSLAAWFSGEFNPLYLYLDLTFIAAGSASAFYFLANPTPRRAHVLTIFFMVGMGMFICLAIILGSL